MKQLKDMVETSLKDDSQCRNSDIYLTHYIWKRWYGVREEITLKRMYDLPSEANLGRWRRHYQEKRLYVPTEWKIAKARGMKQEEWKQALGYIPKGEESRVAIAEIATQQSYLFEITRPKMERLDLG